ncbi:MAG: Mur ligase domain-containing protein [Patescibacteria group bacterium]
MAKVHFIGIGGIGTSALAQYYLSEGYGVSGSDLVASDITEFLEKKGVEIQTGGEFENLIDESLEKVIYTSSVEEDNLELQKANSLGVKTLKYAEALGELTQKYTTLAVSGTHGKSTTTSMLAMILVEAGLDPTVIVGTRLPEFGGSNFRKGEGEYLVIEADEYDRAFWNYRPKITVVTNIDKDHLDTYGDINGVVDGFNQYLKNLSSESIAIMNSQNKYTERAIMGVSCRLAFFNEKGISLDWPLSLPGKFNQLNAEAAWQVAKLIGIERNTAFTAFQKFKGVWRRLEPLEPNERSYPEDTLFFSDYGHHPTEVKSTLEGLREKYPNQKITIIFQPHQVRRLTNVFGEFIEAFDDADVVCLLPVYEVAGREDLVGKSSKDLYETISERNERLDKEQKIYYKESLEDSLAFINGGIVIFMGAGDIDSSVRKYFKSKLLSKKE